MVSPQPLPLTMGQLAQFGKLIALLVWDPMLPLLWAIPRFAAMLAYLAALWSATRESLASLLPSRDWDMWRFDGLFTHKPTASMHNCNADVSAAVSAERGARGGPGGPHKGAQGAHALPLLPNGHRRLPPNSAGQPRDGCRHPPPAAVHGRG